MASHASFGTPAVVPGNEEVSVAVTRSHEKGGVLEDFVWNSTKNTCLFFHVFFAQFGWLIHHYSPRKSNDISIKIHIYIYNIFNIICIFMLI